MPEAASVHWVFTWNANKDDSRAPEEQLRAMDIQLRSLYPDTIDYMQYQSELGTNHHLQGRFQLVERKRAAYLVKNCFTAVKGIHLEKARKGMDSDYELKDDTKTDVVARCILGVKNVAGSSKSKRDFAQMLMDTGISFAAATEQDPYMTMLHGNNIKEICQIASMKKAREATHATHVVWLYQHNGSGAGKTYAARQFAESLGLSWYKCPVFVKGRSPFFTNYAQEDVVIMDEFNEFFPIDLFKQIADTDGCQVQVGVGSSVFFHPKYLIFCTNSEPMRFWPKAKLDPWHFAGFAPDGSPLLTPGLPSGVVNPIERRCAEVIEAAGVYPVSNFLGYSRTPDAPFMSFLLTRPQPPPIPPPRPPVYSPARRPEWDFQDEPDDADAQALPPPPPPPFVPTDEQQHVADAILAATEAMVPTDVDETPWDQLKTEFHAEGIRPRTATEIDLMDESSSSEEDIYSLCSDDLQFIDDDSVEVQHGPIRPISPHDDDDLFWDLDGPSDD